MEIFKILYKRAYELCKSRFQDIKEKSIIRPCVAAFLAIEKESDAAQVTEQILKQIEMSKVGLEQFIRTAVVNRRDEFGNTMLHLAAWNSKKDIYDHLIELGADPAAVNRSGLTPFTLSVRFGLWDIAKHIWNRHFTSVYWSFGNVVAECIDYGDFDAASYGLSAFVSVREIDFCQDALIAHYVHLQSPHGHAGSIKSRDGAIIERRIAKRVEEWCRSLVKDILSTHISQAGWYDTGSEQFNSELERHRRLVGEVPKQAKIPIRAEQVKTAVRIITMFRPDGWYDHLKDLMEEVVLSKWSRGYYLVHMGDSLLPYCLLILLFCLMWWKRNLSVLEHNFWWSSGPIVAPDPGLGIESTCGWQSISTSYSGRMQAALVFYGVPSLLRLAMVQSRLRPTDLDEDVDWKITGEELVNCAYLNLESVLHTVVAGLFLTIGVSRVAAGDQCDVAYVRSEKNATSIAALGLFFNLFILCKPYKGFGLLVLTWYRFLLADLFNFLVMYSMIFAAFLIAIQTLHNANYSYVMWMEQTDTILPQVQAAIQTQFPGAVGNLTYLVNSNAPNSNQLLSTETSLDGCHSFRRSLVDTGFSLLEISFGDGLADALEQARIKPYNCAGFVPDYVLGYLLVLWMFLTNTLIMNMLIAMMNYTFDKQRENLATIWLLDISKRIMRYESSFPELCRRISRPAQIHSMFNLSYWWCKLEDFALVLYCVPEIHFVALIVNAVRVSLANDQLERLGPGWTNILHILKDYEKRHGHKADVQSVFCRHTVTNLTWWVTAMHSTSEKAVAFGSAAEKSESSMADDDSLRVAKLIFRLEQLKQVLTNRKLKTHDIDSKAEEAKSDKETNLSDGFEPGLDPVLFAGSFRQPLSVEKPRGQLDNFFY